jgi:DNA-binding response OmpR family regulator
MLISQRTMGNVSKVNHVLVVEDDFLIAMDVEKTFLDLGCSSVDTVSSCAEGLCRVQHRAYDLVAVDVDLRDGSCARLASYLAEQKTPFVYVSGFQQGDYPGLPPAPWLLKPMSADELAEVVRTLSGRCEGK